MSWLSLLLSKESSGKYLTISEFDSVSEAFSIKASLSRIIPSNKNKKKTSPAIGMTKPIKFKEGIKVKFNLNKIN